MPNEKQGADRDDPSREEGHATGEGVAVEHGPAASSGHRLTRRRKLLIGVIGALVLAAVAAFGIPSIQRALNTVSTDDAYVNGHVTFVAPRVGGQISRVLVDDNNRVHKGELLAYFDCFWIFAVLTFVLVFVAPLMKRSVAEKGARIGGE
jgi:hypothetical protein